MGKKCSILKSNKLALEHIVFCLSGVQGTLSLGQMMLGHEADNSSPVGAKIKN
jgi:hypothetical protein